MQINLTDLGDDAKRWLMESGLMQGTDSPKHGIELSSRKPLSNVLPSPSHTPRSKITLDPEVLQTALATKHLSNAAFKEILAALMNTHQLTENNQLAEVVDAYQNNRKNKTLKTISDCPPEQKRYNTLLRLAHNMFVSRLELAGLKLANCPMDVAESNPAPAPPDAEDPHRSTTAPNASCTIL